MDLKNKKITIIGAVRSGVGAAKLIKKVGGIPFVSDMADEKLLKEYKNIFSIHISSKLSATIKSAIIARDLLRAEKRIQVFDSLSGTMGTGFMVLAAARAARKKYTYSKILNILKYLRKNIRIYLLICRRETLLKLRATISPKFTVVA